MDRYTFEHDPGHGWLGVPIDELIELDIPHKISTCSYWDAASEIVWLEEDCDAETFALAKAAKETGSDDPDVQEDWAVNVFFGRMVNVHHHHDDDRIRKLPHFDIVNAQQQRGKRIDPRWLAITEGA